VNSESEREGCGGIGFEGMKSVAGGVTGTRSFVVGEVVGTMGGVFWVPVVEGEKQGNWVSGVSGVSALGEGERWDGQEKCVEVADETEGIEVMVVEVDGVEGE